MPIFEVRRGILGALIGGQWLPVSIRGGAVDGDEIEAGGNGEPVGDPVADDGEQSELDRVRSDLAGAEARLAEAEAARAAAEATAEQAAADAETARAQAQAAQLEAHRAGLLREHADIVPELVGGSTVEELAASVESSRAVYQRIRAQVEADVQAATVPAGAPPRPTPAERASTGSSLDKIVAGLQAR